METNTRTEASVRLNSGGIRSDVTFPSEGAVLSGWLYTPDSKAPWPLTIMTHGFSATKHMTIDRFAEVFCAAGLAVLLYDHRGFGSSGGEPRQLLNTWGQARGYRDALTYARTIEGIDPARIALWGDSLSAGSALAVAGIDDRVAALVLQVPGVGSQMPPADPDGRIFAAFKETLLSGRIEPSAEELEGPMPVVSDDQVRRPSALQPLTAYRWFIEYGGRLGSDWVNDVTRTRLKSVPWLPVLSATHVSCPTMFVVSPADEMPNAAPFVAREAYERVNAPKEWLDIDGGHFGLLYFPSPEFEQSSTAQARFLIRHLLHA